MTKIISVDAARNSGVAWINDIENKPHIINTTEFLASPITLLQFILSKLSSEDDIILLEDFVYFGSSNSVKTIASLLKRLGYIEYSLLSLGYKNVKYLNLNSVRNKYFKGKNKKLQTLLFFQDNYNALLTDNHTDAILQICYYLDLDINKIKILKK